MATIREQIARHTHSEATQQQSQQPVADDPLAPVPIRFTDWRDVDGGLYQRSVNEPTAAWHLEDDAEASGAEPSPSRQRGQTSTPSRQTCDYRQQARVTQAYPPDYEDADEQYSRPPRSAMRYQDSLPYQYRGQTVLPTPPQHRRRRLTGNAPSQQPRPPRRRSKHWSVYLVTGMATMTALVIGLYSIGSWWQGVQDRWTYGYPRTYQTDAIVGHNHDSRAHPSHFIAVNVRGQVEVFELPAGDPTKVRVFLGPILSGEGADQVVVTISFVDIDHDGTPDLVLRYGDSAEVFFNHDGTFLVPGGKS